MFNIRTFVKLARPIHLLMIALTYTLGAGMAHYLGYPFHVTTFGLGLLTVLAVQVAGYFLMEYFRLPMTPLGKNEILRERELFRAGLFQSAVALLTVSGALAVTLFIARSLTLPAWILLGSIVLLFVIYAVPPLRLSEVGYGELIEAVVLGTLSPAFSFLVQSAEFHRILTFTTFPLTLLALSYLLINDFPTYETDQKQGRQSLLTRLTWQRAIPIHHLSILVSFLFFGVSPILGFPWRLVWPIFLALPFAAFEVFWLQRIALGGRARWNFLVPFSEAVFGLSVYLLMLTFWIR